MLSLLRGLKPELTAEGKDSEAIEDAIGIMFSSVVRAHCRRQDLTTALAEVEEMELAGGEVGADIFSYLLDACAIARPPLLREVETVWAKIEVSATVKGGRASICFGREVVVCTSRVDLNSCRSFRLSIALFPQSLLLRR